MKIKGNSKNTKNKERKMNETKEIEKRDGQFTKKE